MAPWLGAWLHSGQPLPRSGGPLRSADRSAASRRQLQAVGASCAPWGVLAGALWRLSKPCSRRQV